MTSRNRRGATILPKMIQRASKEPRKKRTRPELRQFTLTDLERARDRVGAAERRVASDHSTQQFHSRVGLERARRELHIIESDLRARRLIK
jgi:hypothetical protein